MSGHELRDWSALAIAALVAGLRMVDSILAWRQRAAQSLEADAQEHEIPANSELSDD